MAIELDTIYVPAEPSGQSAGGTYYDDYNPESSGFPESPYGAFSYFYDYYIYNNGLAHINEMLQNLNSPNGHPEIYLKSVAERSIITSMTGMTPFETWYTDVQPDMTNTHVAINPLAPFRGLHHYLKGNGQPLNVDFTEVPLRIQIPDVKISELNEVELKDKPLEQVIQELGAGTHAVTLKFGYDTQNSSFGADEFLGRITLKFIGNITVRNDGSYLIDGEIRAFTDVYDAGKSNRNAMREIATKFLESLNGTDYEVNINGSQKVIYDSAAPNSTGKRIIKTDNPSSQINGSSTGFNTAYFYAKSSSYILQRVSEADVYIYGENMNYQAHHIDRIAFEDTFFQIAGMPIVPIGSGPRIIEGTQS